MYASCTYFKVYASAVIVPWYIMTSEATKDITVNFFHQHNHFGLNSKNIFFFEQETIPCITPDGKIIMETPIKVAKAPNGNGGLFSGMYTLCLVLNCVALKATGALQDMQDRGVEMVLVYGVDNCLIKMADPIFYGYCFENNLDCAAKVVTKAYPEEAGIVPTEVSFSCSPPCSGCCVHNEW